MAARRAIKFALFEAGDALQRILRGELERIGLPQATLRVTGLNHADNYSRLVTAPDHTAAAGALMDWVEEHGGCDALTAVGHRVRTWRTAIQPAAAYHRSNGCGAVPPQFVRSRAPAA